MKGNAQRNYTPLTNDVSGGTNARNTLTWVYVQSEMCTHSYTNVQLTALIRHAGIKGRGKGGGVEWERERGEERWRRKEGKGEGGGEGAIGRERKVEERGER